MFETEIRVKLGSVKEYENLERKLEGMGAKDLGKRRVRDTVYGMKGIYSVRDTGFCCRIREDGNKIKYDRKTAQKANYKEEIFRFKDRDEADRHFKSEGMLPYLVIDRIRHEYSFKDYVIALDDVAMLGQFVEVELSSESNIEVETLKERIRNLIKKEMGLEVKEEAAYGAAFMDKIEKDKGMAEKMAAQLGISLDELFKGAQKS